MPYWFAVPGNAPYGISVLYQKFSAAAGADLRQAIVFRVTDVAGLPYSGPLQPAVNVIDSGGGGGSAVPMRPETYRARMRWTCGWGALRYKWRSPPDR